MTRRAALLLPALLRADERSEVLDVVAPLANALSNGNAADFMSRIPDDSPNRSRLAIHIEGLLAQAEVTCSVRLLNFDKDRAELDWLMDIRSRATQSNLERRKGTVILKLRNRSVFSLEPVDFFKPVEVR